MAPAAAFAQVLDTYLDHPPLRDTAAAGRSSSRVATRGLFWFEGASSVVVTPRPAVRIESASSFRTESASSDAAAQPRGPVSHRSEPVTEPAPRVPRVLSVRQREALDRLIGLGARLDDAFTLQELRSEFRALAQLYHPDRQQSARRPSSPPAGSRFVALRQAYDVLKQAA